MVYSSDEVLDATTLSREDVDEFLKNRGSSLDTLYEQAMQAVEKMLDEWIISNEGKSKFSIGDYGEYSKSELKFYGNIS